MELLICYRNLFFIQVCSDAGNLQERLKVIIKLHTEMKTCDDKSCAMR